MGDLVFDQGKLHGHLGTGNENGDYGDPEINASIERVAQRLVRLVRPIWEWVHNRVTAHVLNRFKALCEARFEELTAGPGTLHGERPANG